MNIYEPFVKWLLFSEENGPLMSHFIFFMIGPRILKFNIPLLLHKIRFDRHKNDIFTDFY